MGQSAAKIRVEAEQTINASAPAVYRAIADYREHHPRFLPPAFSNLTVEQGGVGDGTIICFDLKLGGRKRRMRARISEPMPGRVLEEADMASDSVTRFDVIPEGDSSRVSIRTEWTPGTGVQGWMERRLAPGMLGKLYADELANLDRYARGHEATLTRDDV